MNSFVLTVGKDEYRIAMPTQQAVEAEKRLGTSLFDALEHADQASVQSVMLWAGLQKFNHKMTLEKVYGLMDQMMEEGLSIGGTRYEEYAIDARSALCTEILKAAGFFTSEMSADIDEKMEKAKENL